MAPSKPYDFRLEARADFGRLRKDAAEASKKVSDSFAKALKKGLRGDTYAQWNASLAARIREEKKQRRKLQKILEADRARAGSEEAKQRAKDLRKIAALEENLRKDDLKDETRERMKAEKALAEKRVKLFDDAAQSFSRELSKAFSEFDRAAAEMKQFEKAATKSATHYVRGAERIEKASKFFVGQLDDGIDDFVSRLSDGMESAGSKLMGSLDAGSLSRSIGAGLGKKLGSLGDIVGMKSAKLGLLVGGIGALVAAFGAFLGVMFDVDKKMKEFNRGAIRTYGALELARFGSGKLSDGLRVLNHTVTDLIGNLGLTEEEMMTVLDTFDRAGFTLDRLSGAATTAAGKQLALADSIRNVNRVANATGIGLSEYASDLSNYVNDLGSDLQTVNDSFAQIAHQAASSSFGTRRFYAMVTQASSGQASLNTRLEDTADLLMKMSKVLGAKKATETVAEHANDLQSMSTSDRFRMILTSGEGRVRNTLVGEAGRQARSFAQRANGNSAIGDAVRETGVGSGVASALTAAGGRDADATATRNLVAELAKLSRADQDAFVASVTSRDDALGRQLNQLITVTRGTRGGMGNEAAAMSGVGAGGSIVMRLQSAMAVLGRPLNELVGVERIAAENITGLSGAAYDNAAAIASNAEGQLKILETYLHKQITPETMVDLAKRFGATVVNGEIKLARLNAAGNGIAGYGETITNSMQLVASYTERTGDTLDQIRDEQTQLQYDTYDATVSLGDILENKVLYYVRALYEDVGQPLISWIAKTMDFGGSAATRSAAQGASAAVTSRLEAEQKSVSELSRRVSAANSAVQTTRSGPEREQKVAELKRLQEELAGTRARIEALQGARRRLSGGDYSGLNVTEHKNVEVAMRDRGVATGDTATISREYNRTLSPNEYVSRVVGGAAAPTAPASGAGTASASGAPAVTVAPSSADSNPVGTTTVATGVAAVTDSVNALHTTTTETATRSAREAGTRHTALVRALTRETKLGNALARSELPDAIAEAGVKQQFLAQAFAAGLDGDTASAAMREFFSTGKLTSSFTSAMARDATDPATISALRGLGIRPEDITAPNSRAHRLVRAAGSSEDDGPDVEAPAHDFVYRNDGGRSTITPIDRADSLVGLKPGGPIDRLAGAAGAPGSPGAGGGAVHIHIHGNQQQTYDTVRRVLREAGLNGGGRAGG